MSPRPPSRSRRPERHTEWISPPRPAPVLKCSEARWFAVRVAPNCERFVADEITGSGHVGYCPMGAKLTFWQGRGRTVKHLRNGAKKQFPVFSRYIFAGMMGEDFIQKGMSKKIEAILGNAFGPVLIPSRVVQKINELEIAGQWDETLSWRAKSTFQPGSSVRLLEGPFKGFAATVDELASENKIRLLVALLGRLASVDVSPAQIERV